jgi:hypothetical protein
MSVGAVGSRQVIAVSSRFIGAVGMSLGRRCQLRRDKGVGFLRFFQLGVELRVVEFGGLPVFRIGIG